MPSAQTPRFLLIPLIAYGLLVWLVLPHGRIVDEQVHLAQVDSFLRDQWVILPDLAIWPVLHALLQAPLRLVADPQLQLSISRSLVASLVLAGLLGVWKLLVLSDAGTARLRTLQFFASPIVLPISVLVYTDLPAMAGLVWALYGLRTRRYGVYFLAITAAMLLRQSNILWLLAFSLYGLWTARHDTDRGKLALLAGGTALLVLAWAAVAYLLGGVAAGSTTQHDHLLVFKGLPNIQFMFALGLALHAPLLLASFRTGPGTGIRIALFGGFALFTWLTFGVSHRFNNFGQTYFLRNMLLEHIVLHGMVWFSLVAGLGAALFLTYRFAHDYRDIRLPFWITSALYLLPFWLIEQRYYLPVYLMFNLMRAPASPRVEQLQLAWNLALSAAALYFIARMQHFL